MWFVNVIYYFYKRKAQATSFLAYQQMEFSRSRRVHVTRGISLSPSSSFSFLPSRFLFFLFVVPTLSVAIFRVGAQHVSALVEFVALAFQVFLKWRYHPVEGMYADGLILQWFLKTITITIVDSCYFQFQVLEFMQTLMQQDVFDFSLC